MWRVLQEEISKYRHDVSEQCSWSINAAIFSEVAADCKRQYRGVPVSHVSACRSWSLTWTTPIYSFPFAYDFRLQPWLGFRHRMRRQKFPTSWCVHRRWNLHLSMLVKTWRDFIKWPTGEFTLFCCQTLVLHNGRQPECENYWRLVAYLGIYFHTSIIPNLSGCIPGSDLSSG